MWKKSVCGLTILAAGLLVWSCGDGSVDSLSDNELMMISRFPSTIDYDMLDSVVNACKNDAVCWEKAKKTGEIYKGDYTKVLRDSSGNIVVVEGDSAFIWKDGKKLPVFDFSSNSAGDDDDVTSSSVATSGSSSKYSSAAGYDEDEYRDIYNDDSNGSTGKSSVARASGSSSSQKSGNSSSIDMSVLSCSSSQKVAGETSASINLGSSSSKMVISVSSVSQSSSSEQVVRLSSSSVAIHSNNSGNNGPRCAEGSVSGTCTVASIGYIREPVTYTVTLDENSTCDLYSNIEWNVTTQNDGASVTHEDQSYQSAQESYTFNVSYSTIGDKASVLFSMGGENIVCGKTNIRRRCEANEYTCTRTLLSATNNLAKNPVQYRWDFSYSGCLAVSSHTWNGALSGSSGNSVTKTFTGSSLINQPVSLSIVDELHGQNGEGSPVTKACDPAYAVYEPDLPPTCAVANIAAGTGLNVTVTPSSVTGCAYDDSKCSYSLTLKNDAGVIVSSPNGYNGGALTSFVGSSTDKETLTYTLTLKNYLGGNGGSCDFEVTYYDEVPVTATTTFLNYSAGGTYSVTIGNETRNGFFCKSSTNSSQIVIGTFGGNQIKMNGYNPVSVSSGNVYLFEVLNSAPSDLKCGIAYN